MRRSGSALRSQPCRSGKQPRGGSWCADPGKAASVLHCRRSGAPDAVLLQLLPLHGDAPAGAAQPENLHAPGALPRATAACLGALGLLANSLAVYQGLVYYLLWLHSKYDKVGAVRGGSYLRWYRRGFYAGGLRRRAEQSRAASVLPRLKGEPRRGSSSAPEEMALGWGQGRRSGRKPGLGVYLSVWVRD